MNVIGLYYFDSRDQEFTFVNTVSNNKEGFRERQIKGAEVARSLYTTLIYPSAKDYKWAIISNQIKTCPLTVQDVEVAQNVWGKNIAALKGNINLRNPNIVARDQVKIPVELIKFHNKVFLTCNIFFVRKISLFRTLSRKIYFTAVNHL